jgi:hypothetical protein
MRPYSEWVFGPGLKALQKVEKKLDLFHIIGYSNISV